MSHADDPSLEDIRDIVAQRQGGNTDNSRWRGECEDVLEALERAETPLTLDQVGMLTFLGTDAARRRLNDLREDGTVERVRDPQDRRVIRYAPADGAGGDDD